MDLITDTINGKIDKTTSLVNQTQVLVHKQDTNMRTEVQSNRPQTHYYTQQLYLNETEPYVAPPAPQRKANATRMRWQISGKTRLVSNVSRANP